MSHSDADEWDEGAPPALDGRAMVGRQRDVATVEEYLASHRVVTLMGQAGSGKTRMAKQLAWDHRTKHTVYDKVTWVGFDAIPPEKKQSAEDAVREAIAYAMGLRRNASHVGIGVPQDKLKQVAAKLRAAGTTLLVLDNCEHVILAAGKAVETLLATAPELTVLTTSQQKLGVSGELCHPLDPLPVPNADDASAADSASIRLLEARALEQDQMFKVSDHLPTLVELVHVAGGLPLVINYMARRCATASPIDALEQVETPEGLIGLQGGDRYARATHTSLDSALGYMWNLSTPEVKCAWAWLSELPGSFEQPTAVKLCSGGSVRTAEGDTVTLRAKDVQDLLSVMVESSLLQRELVAGRARFRMPPTLRAWGQLQLAERGETEMIRTRALEAFVELARKAETSWFSSDELRWIKVWRWEKTNLGLVLAHAAETDPESGLRVLLGCIASRGGIYEGMLGETVQHLDTLLQRVPADSTPELVAVGYAMAAWLRSLLGDPDGAGRDLELACQYERTAQVTLPEVLMVRGIYTWWSGTGTPSEALALLTAALDAFGTARPAMRHLARLYAAMCAAFEGLPEAEKLAEGVAGESRRAGGPWAQSWADYAGMVANIHKARSATGAERDRLLAAAHRKAKAAASLWKHINDRFSAAWVELAFAWWAAEQGKPQLTALMLGSACRVQEQTDEQIGALSGPKQFTERAERLAREALGTVEYDAIFQRGYERDEHVALETALTFPDSDARPLPEGVWRVIQLLVRRGEKRDVPTNREIAQWAQLDIRTVEGYMRDGYEYYRIKSAPGSSIGRNKLAQIVREWHAQHPEDADDPPTESKLPYVIG